MQPTNAPRNNVTRVPIVPRISNQATKQPSNQATKQPNQAAIDATPFALLVGVGTLGTMGAFCWIAGQNDVLMNDVLMC